MKVLIISHKPPFPIVDGGCLAMSRFLECLSGVERIDQIIYYALSTHKHPYFPNQIPNEKFPNVRFENHHIDTEIKPISALYDLIKGNSYNLSRFYDKEAAKKLNQVCLSTNVDYVIFESLFACVYLNDLKNIGKSKFIYRAHNIENSIWKNLFETTDNPIKKWYIHKLYKKLKGFELQLINDVDYIFPLSTKDNEIIQKLTKRPTYLIPVSMPTFVSEISYEKTSLCFIGAFNWTPNIEAMNWFASDILQELRKEFPLLELHIAGSFSENISHLNKKAGVVLHGFVESSLDFIANHGIFIAPLKSGSGVKMKVLEAMSLGCPVVMSEKGAEGIVGKPHFCRNSTEFIDEIKNLLKSQKTREEKGFQGKVMIEKNYNPTSLQKKMLDLFIDFENEKKELQTQLNSNIR